MCVSCGCHLYEDDHGNADHILLTEVKQAGGPEAIPEERLQRAADAAEISTEDALNNIQTDFLAASS